MAKRRQLDEWKIPPGPAKPLRISNAKVIAYDADFREAVERRYNRRAWTQYRTEGQSPSLSFFDWWMRVLVLVGTFFTDRDFATVDALARHLLPNLQGRVKSPLKTYWTLPLDREAQWALKDVKVAERRSDNEILFELIERALLDWHDDAPDLPFGEMVWWFRRQLETRVKADLVGRALLLTAHEWEDDPALDDLASSNDPNWHEKETAFDHDGNPVAVATTPEAQARRHESSAPGDEEPRDGCPLARATKELAQGDDPRVAQLKALYERLATLPLKGMQRRIAELIQEDPTRTEADLARRLGTSADSVRRSLSEITRKLRNRPDSADLSEPRL